MALTIVIGNKNYSSWSLRPWIVLAEFGFAFEEVVIPLDQENTKAEILAYSPSGRVPCLVDGATAVWDSLAIIEYLAELAPDKPIWPGDPKDRALARSLAAEMHAGFTALRSACPMNLKKTFPFRDWGGRAAAADVARFEQIVRDRSRRTEGPFLFGAFGAVDAMYLPLATRLRTYSWPMEGATRAYVDALHALEGFKRWHAAALEEHWIVPADEV